MKRNKRIRGREGGGGEWEKTGEKEREREREREIKQTSIVSKVISSDPTSKYFNVSPISTIIT